MLHASAVEIDNCAVVFMGKSGQGKSTLAADFASHGFRFLTDDGLLLEKSATAYIVQPSHPSIRLWHDSQTALISERTRRAPPVQFTNKARLLAGESIAFCAEPTPLSRVYFLGNDNVTGPVFNRLKPAEALVELLKNSFLLDIDMRERLVEHFDQLTHLVSEPIFFHLNFPRRYTMLDQVRHAIVAHARNQE